MLHPSSGLTKEYIATVDKPATRKQIENLRLGCDVDGVHVTVITPQPRLPRLALRQRGSVALEVSDTWPRSVFLVHFPSLRIAAGGGWP